MSTHITDQRQASRPSFAQQTPNCRLPNFIFFCTNTNIFANNNGYLISTSCSANSRLHLGFRISPGLQNKLLAIYYYLTFGKHYPTGTVRGSDILTPPPPPSRCLSTYQGYASCKTPNAAAPGQQSHSSPRLVHLHAHLEEELERIAHLVSASQTERGGHQHRIFRILGTHVRYIQQQTLKANERPGGQSVHPS